MAEFRERLSETWQLAGPTVTVTTDKILIQKENIKQFSWEFPQTHYTDSRVCLWGIRQRRRQRKMDNILKITISMMAPKLFLKKEWKKNRGEMKWNNKNILKYVNGAGEI